MAVKKLTDSEINAVKVEGRGNPLKQSVKENQRIFDALPLKVNEKLNDVIDAVNSADTALSGHAASKTNPHGVTKAQVGLGNVNNTSDLNKPVSNAVAAELAKKANAEDVYTKTEVDKKIAGIDIPDGGGANVDLSNYLSKDNTEAYTPSSDYNPATKKYVDDTRNDFVMTAEADENENVIIDKTFEEITIAVHEGKNVYVHISGDDEIIRVPLVVADTTRIIFQSVAGIKIVVLSNDTLTTDMYDVITTTHLQNSIDESTDLYLPPTTYAVSTFVSSAIRRAIGDVLGGAS